MSIGCLAGVRKVSGICLKGVWRLLEEYLEGDMASQDRLNQDRSSQDRSIQIRSCQIKSCQNRSCKDRLSQDSQTQLNMHLRMEFDSSVGPTCFLLFLGGASPLSKFFL